MVGIANFQQQIFSVRSRPGPPIFKNLAVRSSLHPAKIGLSPDPCCYRTTATSTTATQNKCHLEHLPSRTTATRTTAT